MIEEAEDIDFTCPKCGSKMWKSLVINPDWHHSEWRWRRFCQGGVIALDEFIPCDFKWHEQDEEELGFVNKK